MNPKVTPYPNPNKYSKLKAIPNPKANPNSFLFKLQMKHDAPALSCSIDGTNVCSGGCDRAVKLWDLNQNSNQGQTIGCVDIFQLVLNPNPNPILTLTLTLTLTRLPTP